MGTVIFENQLEENISSFMKEVNELKALHLNIIPSIILSFSVLIFAIFQLDFFKQNFTWVTGVGVLSLFLIVLYSASFARSVIENQLSFTQMHLDTFLKIKILADTEGIKDSGKITVESDKYSILKKELVPVTEQISNGPSRKVFETVFFLVAVSFGLIIFNIFKDFSDKLNLGFYLRSFIIILYFYLIYKISFSPKSFLQFFPRELQ